MDRCIGINEEFKYGTLEAMRLIKEDHYLVFESIEEYQKGKNILKYCEYIVYPNSGIVNQYDNCIHLQPTLNKEFLEIAWRLISERTKEKIKVSGDVSANQVKEKNVLKGIVGCEVQIYDTFEALDFLKNNPSIYMEWIENKNYGRTRLRFERDRIVKDYNGTSYTPPELKDEFLSRYWKIGMNKVIKFLGEQ